MKAATPRKMKRQNNKGSGPIVDSLATALSLLDYFTVSEPELSLGQLSEKSGLYKSRIHRLCGTLVLSGFLIRTPWSSYRLGPKLMTLGKIYENTNTLLTISRPIMKELANSTGESVALFSLDGETSFCLARELGSSRLVFSIQEGDHMQLHACSGGLGNGPQTQQVCFTVEFSTTKDRDVANNGCADGDFDGSNVIFVGIQPQNLFHRAQR